MTKPDIFKYFKTSPQIIRLAVMMYVRYPLSLRNVEDLLHERGIEISHEKVRFWWNRFGLMFAAEIRRKRVQHLRAHSNWQWHLDEVFVTINGERHYLWCAVDHEGEVLESYVTKRRDRKAALKFLRKKMKCLRPPHVIVTDPLRSYGAAMKVIGNADKQETGRWLNNRAENFKPMWQLLGSGYTGLPDERLDASSLGYRNAKKKVSNPLPGVDRHERPIAAIGGSRS